MSAVPETSSVPDRRPVPESGFSVGLGLTNECNLDCSFCYRDRNRVDRLTLEQVQAVMERMPVRSVNLGTGESGMHPDFKTILQYLRTLPVKLTITSNGYTIARLSDDELRAFHDVEFSLDYPSEVEQDAQRGAGNWALVHQQADRCRRLAVPVTIIAVMMKSNYLRLAAVARIARSFHGLLRVNVYQPVHSDLYALSYEEYWEGFQQLFAETDVVDVGESLVRAVAGLPARHRGCGLRTIRVTPRATTQPCVYWSGAGESLSTLLAIGDQVMNSTGFARTRTLPLVCEPCHYRDVCRGGCAGRRELRNALAQPDPYCPVVRGDSPKLDVRVAASNDLPKSESSCTTIVRARD